MAAVVRAVMPGATHASPLPVQGQPVRSTFYFLWSYFLGHSRPSPYYAATSRLPRVIMRTCVLVAKDAQ
jgi:hypothetical protein